MHPKASRVPSFARSQTRRAPGSALNDPRTCGLNRRPQDRLFPFGMTSRPETINPVKLIDELADRIHARIVSGDYPPGFRLKQENLASEFAVSRTPIREALSRLEGRGVVIQAQRRSAIVRAPTRREITEMYQVRAELEGLAAELAAKWLSDQQLSSLRRAHDDFVDAVKALRQVKRRAKSRPLPEDWERTSGRWVDLNTTFHRAIGEASTNAYLSRTIQDLSTGYTRALIQSSSDGLSNFRVDANIMWHERILSALENREPLRARTAMVEHIREAGELVGALFERSTTV